MMDRQFLIMRALTLSGSHTLISGRDNATWRTSSHVSPDIKRLIDGREVNTDLLGDPYVVFFGQVQGGLCGILRTAAKKLVEFICCGCQIF